MEAREAGKRPLSRDETGVELGGNVELSRCLSQVGRKPKVKVTWEADIEMSASLS
jgi:hypothetical protein